LQVRKKHEKAAEGLWFALYGLIHRPHAASTASAPAPSLTDRDATAPPSALSTTVAGVEEFIQTATLGEYQKRLQMVAAFGGEIRIRARSAGSSHLAPLAAALKTVHSYYRQFEAVVLEALRGGGEPVEKELREFVRLQKWEDRNVYALQMSAERSHRKLHKLASKLDVSTPATVTMPSESSTQIDHRSMQLMKQSKRSGRRCQLSLNQGVALSGWRNEACLFSNPVQLTSLMSIFIWQVSTKVVLGLDIMKNGA
jgi:midasin (ATPase involved in ribosome maturation)